VNALESYLIENKIDEIQAMNALQNRAIISDNCVLAADVIDCDIAIDWLKKNRKENK
jgi:hypothetical protein